MAAWTHLGAIARRLPCGRIAVVAVVTMAACSSPEAPATQGAPGTRQAEVMPTYIQRLPEMDFVVGSANPTRDGWPAVGQTVTWRAHLKNWGSSVEDVPYAWTLDGDTIEQGSVNIPADSTATVDLPWSWTFQRHVLGITVDPHDVIVEQNEQNNTLEVYTDALSVGFWVEQGYYDYYRAHISDVNAALSSFEDWVQLHIRRLNEMYAAAIYAETPDGVLDRVRIDKIVVVPDGSLASIQRPAPDDRTVDMEWGFTAAEAAYLSDGPGGVGYSPVFEYQGSLLHELGHARYLTDVYLWDLADREFGRKIDIQEDSAPLVGSRYLPVLTTILVNGQDSAFLVHSTPEMGLMNTDYSYVDRYSAIALNLIAHQRPLYGNYNCPLNCGAFRADLPAQNVLDLESDQGEPLAGASVEIYRSAFRQPDPFSSTPPYDDYFDNVADFSGTADAGGHLEVGGNPFGVDSTSLHLPRRHVIIRVAYQGEVGYAVLESRIFNLAYWHGQTAVAHYPVSVKLFGPP